MYYYCVVDGVDSWQCTGDFFQSNSNVSSCLIFLFLSECEVHSARVHQQLCRWKVIRFCNLPLMVKSSRHCLQWHTIYPDSARELREIQKLHNNEYLGRDQKAGPNHRVRVGVNPRSATSTPTSGVDKDNTKTDDPHGPKIRSRTSDKLDVHAHATSNDTKHQP